MKLILLIFALFINISAQQVREINSKYFLGGDYEINLTSDAIRISSNNAQKFLADIDGFKNFLLSPQNEYSLICNYAFNEQQPEFEINLFMFDKDYELVNEFKVVSASDLPHPLFKISDTGVVFSFDPLSLKIKKYEGDNVEEYELEKDVLFEMERAAFLEIADDAVYVLTSIKPLMINSNEENALLYKMNLNNFLVDKTIIDLSVPTLLFADGNEIYVSGVKFNNSVPAGSTFKLDNSTVITSSNNLNIKKMILFEDGYLAQTDNSIIKISQDLSVLAEYKMDGNRLNDFTANAGKISALVNNGSSNSIVTLDENLNLLDQTSIQINDITDYSSIKINEGNLIIHTGNKTYMVE